MSTSILDTGEAFLSAPDKRLVRLGFRPAAPEVEAASAVSPVLTAVLFIIAAAALVVAAMIG